MMRTDTAAGWTDDDIRQGPGDNDHWGYDSAIFWMNQGKLGQVGECNAIIAANELLTVDDNKPVNG